MSAKDVWHEGLEVMSGKPLTKAESTRAVRTMHENMRQYGWWNKICVHCGGTCGGRAVLSDKPKDFKPTAEELRYVTCPRCYDELYWRPYNGNDHIRLEFVPPVKEGV